MRSTGQGGAAWALVKGSDWRSLDLGVLILCFPGSTVQGMLLAVVIRLEARRSAGRLLGSWRPGDFEESSTDWAVGVGRGREAHRGPHADV